MATGNLNHQRDCHVVSLAAFRAQKRRRGLLTAQTHAGRGLLITALLIIAGAFTGYTLHREQQLNDVHHLRHVPVRGTR